jgi:hypothetical protein
MLKKGMSKKSLERDNNKQSEKKLQKCLSKQKMKIDQILS